MSDRPVAVFRQMCGDYVLVLGRAAIRALECGDSFLASIGAGQVVSIGLTDEEGEDPRAREDLRLMMEAVRRLRDG